MEAPNYARLSEGLKIFRDSALTFVIAELKDAYGRLHWWEHGIARHFKGEELDNLRQLFESRAERISVISPPSDELWEMLGVNHIRNIVLGGWREVFQAKLKDRELIAAWLKEIGDARNTWAHPGSGDVKAADAFRLLDTCVRITALFDEATSRKLEGLRDGDGPVRDPPVIGPTETRPILQKLAEDFLRNPRRSSALNNAEVAQTHRAAFLDDYPFRDRPESVYQVMSGHTVVTDFLRRLERQLRPLGGINMHGQGPYREAVANIDKFRSLLHQAAGEGTLTISERVDAAWDQLRGFGGADRQIAKKIVATYYPERTVPIFNTQHLLYFVQRLGLEETANKYRQLYGQLDDRQQVGARWDLLSKAILACREQVPILRSEDNVYLMYCLYYGDPPPSYKNTLP